MCTDAATAFRSVGPGAKGPLEQLQALRIREAAVAFFNGATVQRGHGSPTPCRFIAQARVLVLGEHDLRTPHVMYRYGIKPDGM